MYVTCGLPGSGKSTWARRERDRTGALIVSADDVMIARGIDLYDATMRDRLEQEGIRSAARYLRAGRSVIIDFGSWSREERDALLAMGRACGVPVHLVTFDADDATLLARIAARRLEERHGHRPFVAEDVATARAAFDPPTDDERSAYDPIPVP